jgi:hypothetical protein
VFLAAMVVLSCLPYLGGLGLYSDDWTFLAALHDADGSYRGLLAAVMPIELATRPVQGVVLATLYWLFGLNILGWHAANCAILAGAVLLFYHSLRLLGVARIVALGSALVFGLLPHYSTARFWIAVFQANAAVFLYFLSLYADTRFVARSRGLGWLWKAVGTVALAGSLLAYEVTALLFVVNVVVLLVFAGVRRHGKWVRQAMPTALALASNLLVLALTVGYKVTTTVRTDVVAGYRFRALRIFTEAAPVHFGDYGLALPVRVGQALRHYPDAAVIVVSGLIGLITAAYLLLVARRTAVRPRHLFAWPAVILVGAVLFVAGYGVSLMTWEIGFHMTGANNRTAIGATIGVAWVFVGVIGWISSALPTEAVRRGSFAVLLGLLAASGTLLTGTVAGFWVDAWRQQQALIETIQQRFPALPAGSALLLDGICPYEGPAPVFATGWDTTGMLQLTYLDRSLRGDVMKPNTVLTPEGVRTMLFDDVINLYPYGEDLIVLHVGRSVSWRLTSQDVAREYLEAVSIPGRPRCPPYTDGDGADIFQKGSPF